MAVGTQPLPLPQHKFGPHDVVNIRPNKADVGAAGDAVARYVVSAARVDEADPRSQHLRPVVVRVLVPTRRCLCISGVVYRLRETAIVIAVDEAPEDGLEQPLRLEKLANTVKIGLLCPIMCKCCRPCSAADRAGNHVRHICVCSAEPGF